MIGKTVSHYEIIEEIGGGGMGVVYKARDTKLDRFVALKFLSPHLVQTPDEKTRFTREAKAASSLDHPNICNIHEIDETEDGRMFIAMGYYEGESLADRIKRGPLPIDEAVSIAAQIAQGLANAHENDIVHRDIKPANIIVTKDDVAKIVDFGLAKLANKTLITKEGSTLGTISYMSPEQGRGEDVDGRTDLWSLGVVLYEMVTGRRPFEGDYEQTVIYNILNTEAKPAKAIRGDSPDALNAIIERTLQKKPQSRFGSMDELSRALKALQSPTGDSRSFLQSIARPQIAIPLLLVVAVIAYFTVQAFRQASKQRWARFTLLPEAVRLIDEQDYVGAFLKLQQVESYIPDDPQLVDLKSRCSRSNSIQTTPPGADIYFKDYLDVHSDWVEVGRSPIEDAMAPATLLRWRVIKEGFEPREFAFSGWSMTLHFDLVPVGEGQEGMVYVPAGRAQLGRDKPVEVPPFWLDRYEVTNRQYMEFVEAGGYQKREYWKHPFVRDGQTLSWEEAMEEFQDGTGRPGPATWEVGSYPDGKADYPVGGVSWYEAAAYAEFAGKTLPTVYHWRHAAQLNWEGEPLVLSNFAGKGPALVGASDGLNAYGNYDMLGNVKEWCWNATGDERYILGGAWTDPPYMYDQAQPPFRRTETFGFRCVRSEMPYSEIAMDPIEAVVVDFNNEQPAGDDLFEIHKAFYDYDRTDLQTEVEFVDESPTHWRVEKVSFNVAYGSERMPAYLFLPKNTTPPYQTVVFFPGAGAQYVKSSENLTAREYWEFIPRSGRALIYPVYQDTYERIIEDPQGGALFGRDIVVQWCKDVQRSIDYLETRDDIDMEKLAYYSISLGSTYASIYTSIEDRFEVSVLMAGGLYPHSRPEVDPLNFLPHVTVPTLMINGRQDFMLPLETSVKPMFHFLGTSPDHKRLSLFDADHIPATNDVIRETLDWLDDYLGPVETTKTGS